MIGSNVGLLRYFVDNFMVFLWVKMTKYLSNLRGLLIVNGCSVPLRSKGNRQIFKRLFTIFLSIKNMGIINLYR